MTNKTQQAKQDTGSRKCHVIITEFTTKCLTLCDTENVPSEGLECLYQI